MSKETPIYDQITDFFKTPKNTKVGPTHFCANCNAPLYNDRAFCNDLCIKAQKTKVRALLSR